MQTFELYGEAWIFYIALGITLLALIGFKMKAVSWNIRFAILSLLAVGAFTPDTVANAETYAPLILTALLKAETDGSSAIVSGLVKLVIIWGIVFTGALAARHFWLAKKQTPQNN